MRKPVPVLTVAAAVFASVVAVLFTTAAQATTPPPLKVRIYDARSGGYQIGFWMSHSAGWKWSGTTAGAKRLGCSVSGTYSGDASPAPPQTYSFSGTVKPTSSPYLAFLSVNHWNNGPITIHATCTLRRMSTTKIWIYKTVKANWDGT